MGVNYYMWEFAVANTEDFIIIVAIVMVGLVFMADAFRKEK